MPPSTCSLLDLPPELLVLVHNHLPNRDIKSLRLTCLRLRDLAPLRIPRVFLSTNARNVEVFLTIANHETLRQKVIEIIWDDAVFYGDQDQYFAEEFGTLSRDRLLERRLYESGINDPEQDNAATLPPDIAEDNLSSGLLMDESFKHYIKLLQSQDEVRHSRAHVDALRYGLRKFPALKRITITVDAHGGPSSPRYPSPMVREFPQRFIYPFPRRWTLISNRGGSHDPHLARPWSRLPESDKNSWEGVREVLKILGRQQETNQTVSELVLDAGKLATGLTYRIFDEPCQEYNDLVCLLQRPGFRRLDLAITIEFDDDTANRVTGQQPLFRSGMLRRALGAATDLEHIHLRVCSEHPPRDLMHTSFVLSSQIPPLSEVFPIERWPRLRHLGLSRLIVRGYDLITFLSTMPATLRSVELSFLQFARARGSYSEVLIDMKYKLDWARRQKEEQPRVTICAIAGERNRTSRSYVRACDEIQDYLYRSGTLPFLGNEYNGNRQLLRY